MTRAEGVGSGAAPVREIGPMPVGRRAQALLAEGARLYDAARAVLDDHARRSRRSARPWRRSTRNSWARSWSPSRSPG